MGRYRLKSWSRLPVALLGQWNRMVDVGVPVTVLVNILWNFVSERMTNLGMSEFVEGEGEGGFGTAVASVGSLLCQNGYEA
jgi:hypothetical protein